MATLNEASFTAACLLIISELIRCKNDLRFQLYSFDQIVKSSSINNRNDDDDEEERFYDVDKEIVAPTVASNIGKNGGSSLYDPLKREPKFSNAESCPLFELIQLTFHTHPTVKLWASNLL